MATGKQAFSGGNSAEIFDAILNRAPVAAVRLNPDVPAKLEDVINKALEKDRNLRYRHAEEMRTDLQRLKRDTESGRSSVVDGTDAPSEPAAAIAPVGMVPETKATTSSVGPAKTASRPGRLNWILVAGAAVVIVAATVGGWLYFARRAQAHMLTEKDTIVLGDFSNTTGDAIFDDTLKTALNVSLRQSPFLNVLSDSEVAKNLQRMIRPASAKLTPDVARELCQRAGSKAYIAGTIGSLGSEYVLGLKAVNCRSGDTLAEEQLTAASKEKVLDTLGEATSKLRAELGESLSTVQKLDVPLEWATTSSLEALQAFSLGAKAANEKGPVAALLYDQRSIQLDPNFAVGYEAVGVDYYNLGELGRASEYITKAFQLREHTSEPEKLGIAAAYYRNVTGELDKAMRIQQEYIEAYPRSAEPYSNLGELYAVQGQYEKAAEAARQAIRLAPGQSAVYADLVVFTLALQRFDEARQDIHEAQTRQLEDFTMH